MSSISVTVEKHSFVFSRDGRFLTSVPIRRWSPSKNSDGTVKWIRSNPRCGEVIDLIRRLTLTVNSGSPESLLSKISSELNTPYTPTETLVKSRNTRIKNFNDRRNGIFPTTTESETSSREVPKRPATRRRSETRTRRTATRRATQLPVTRTTNSTEEAA